MNCSASVTVEAEDSEFVEVDPTGRYGRVIYLIYGSAWLFYIHTCCFFILILGFGF